MTNKKKIMNRIAGSSAIVITALGSGAGAVVTQIPGIVSTAFATEVNNVTATATLDVGIQENNSGARTDKFEISTNVNQKVKDGDTVTFTAQGLSARSLNGKEVKTTDGTVIGVIKTKTGLGSPTGPDYWDSVYYKDKNNLSKLNNDLSPSQQEISEIKIVFNKKAEEFQNLSFKIVSNNNRTSVVIGNKDRVEKINIKLGEKTLVEKENKVLGINLINRTAVKNYLWFNNDTSNIYNTEKGLGNGAVSIASGPAKNKGYKTGDKLIVELPNDSGVKIDVNRAHKVGDVLTRNHGRSAIEDNAMVNANGAFLTKQNPIKLKVVEMSADKAVYEVVDQPDFYTEDINIDIPVVTTDVSKIDQAKNRVNVKFNLSFESKLDPTLNTNYETKDTYIPIRGTSLSSTGVKLEFKTTQWLDVDTNKNIKASKVDTKTFPADTIEGYTFVRTFTDPKSGNVTHFFKKKQDEKPRDDVKDIKTTRFLEEGTNKILKPEQKGDKSLEAGTISGYTFVKSDVKGDVTTHFFKKAEEPKKPETPKVEEPKKPEEPKAEPKEVATIFKDDKGNNIKTEKGTKDKEDLPGYKYLRTEKDKDGNTIHIYHKIVTRHIENKDGKVVVLKEEEGNQPKGSFTGYEFVETKVNPDNGDVTHIYKATPEKPAEAPKDDITTFFKDDKGNIIKTEKGPKDKEDIPGYKYLRTEKDKDGNTLHIYHKIVTRHVENKDGKVVVLKEEEGNKPKTNINGYEFVETKVDPENGDVTHYYKANTKTPDKKDAVKTGANASAAIAPLIGVFGGAGVIGAALYVAKKRK